MEPQPSSALPASPRRGELTVGGLLEVDVGIAEGSTGDHVSAYSDGQDGPGWAELLVEHGLGNVWMQVPHIEGRHRVARRAGVHVRRARVLRRYR